MKMEMEMELELRLLMMLELRARAQGQARKTFASSNPKIGNLSFMNLQNSRRLYQNKLIRRQLELELELKLELETPIGIGSRRRFAESLDDDEGPPTKNNET